MHSGNRLIATYIDRLQWDMLDTEVQHKAKICMLDTLGACLAGSITEVHDLTTDYAAELNKGNEATLFLTGGKQSTAAGAAMANSYTANAFDIDDTGNGMQGHPGAQLIPTSLAVAEKTGKDGAETLTALIAGYEVAFRVALCWHDHQGIYQSCGSWGSVANAAIACKLMNLNECQIEHALGIAEYFSPNVPMLRDLNDPAMVKSGSGWGAFTGVNAAELAARGFTGIPSILGFDKYRPLIRDIGIKYYMLDQLWFKDFACCGFTHGAILAALMLREKYNIKPEDITKIVIEGDHYMVKLGTKLPVTTEEAQFNTAWPVAVSLYDGDVGPQQMHTDRLNDKRVQSLAKKIQLVELMECSEQIEACLKGSGGKSTSRVKITLNSGCILDSGFVDGFDGKNYGIQTEDSWFEDKFRRILRNIVSEEKVDNIIEWVWRFDKLEDVSEFTTLIA